MNELTKHYRLLLGLDAAWEVSKVDLSLEENLVEILVTHLGGSVTCPECGEACSIADHAPERTWRHLDTMQFETRLRARTPRANCSACGVKTTHGSVGRQAFAIHAAVRGLRDSSSPSLWQCQKRRPIDRFGLEQHSPHYGAGS